MALALVTFSSSPALIIISTACLIALIDVCEATAKAVIDLDARRKELMR